MSPFVKRLLTFFILLLIVANLCAQQQSIDSVQQLNEVVVSYKADKLTPVTYLNLKGSDLKLRSTGQEPSFLLSQTPSITVYSDAGNTQGYSYFRMRGIDQTRINISLDGVPLNEPEDQGAYFSNYPDIFNSVSNVQLQRGVGTSKNGVASYGGSVQLFSPSLSDSSSFNFGAGYGSFNSLRAFGEYNSGMVNHAALYVRTSQLYSDGYKYNSSNNSRSVFLSGGLFYDKSTWKINVLAGHQQNKLAWLGVSDSLISVDRRTNANENERDKFTQCLVQLENKLRISSSSAIQSSIYYTYLKGNFDYNPHSVIVNEMDNYAFKSDLLGFYSNYTWSLKYFTLTSGVHGNIYARHHIGSDNINGQLYTNTGYKNEVSVFAKANYSVKKFTLFADVQYRTTSFNYQGSVPLDKMHWNFLNPKGGVTYEIMNHSQVYYSIGRSGREPTRNDMFGGYDDLIADDSGNPAISIKNPEYVIDQELGIRHQSENSSINFNLYYMSFRNEIVLDGKFGPNGLALTNKVDRSFRSGAEASIIHSLGKHFATITNASYNYSRIKEQKTTFTPILTPPLIINEEVTFTNKRLLLGLAVRYQDQSYIDFANENALNQYYLFNARAHYTAGNFQFSIFFNNILNTKYINNGYVDYDGSKKYFVQAPGTLSVAVKYSFL